MTGLLTAAAVITTIVLLISASHTGSKATAADPTPRGPWGITTWTSTRNRPLDPHERRWQTALLSARDNPSRWRDLVNEIESLERFAGITGAAPAPSTHDATWVDARIAVLQAAMAAKSVPTHSTPSSPPPAP